MKEIAKSILGKIFETKKNIDKGKRQLVDFNEKFIVIIDYLSEYGNTTKQKEEYSKQIEGVVMADPSDYESKIIRGWSQKNDLDHLGVKIINCSEKINSTKEKVKCKEKELKEVKLDNIKLSFYKEIKNIFEQGFHVENLSDYKNLLNRINKYTLSAGQPGDNNNYEIVQKHRRRSVKGRTFKKRIQNFFIAVISFVKEYYKKIIKHLFICLLILLVSLYFLVRYPGSSESISGIFTWIIMCYVLFIYFHFIQIIMERREISSLEKRLNKPNKKSLYYWLGNIAFHDITIYKWLKDEEEEDITKNLTAIRESIVSGVGSETSDYYLLKTYLEYHGKNNFMNSLWKSFGPIAIAGLGGTIFKLEILDNIYIFLAKKSEAKDVFSNVETIVQTGSLTLMFLILFLFIKYEFTKEKRRIDLLIDIVSIIIKDRENRTKQPEGLI